MDLKKLFDMQRELDNRIINEHKLQGESLFSQKVLALQVEVGELANETRCFKFWSNKGPSEKDVILEEYVDCLHFILSIGIDRNFDDAEVSVSKFNYKITEQFLDLYIDINDFIICASKDHYTTLFEDFISLGINLGFSEEEIEAAYLRKNTINHERQSSGY
ncbi:MAG: dUTP diphosphatase [Bacillota bacterium]|nr:dUTP diphosphatase [Bacillota bacterium]